MKGRLKFTHDLLLGMQCVLGIASKTLKCANYYQKNLPGALYYSMQEPHMHTLNYQKYLKTEKAKSSNWSNSQLII